VPQTPDLVALAADENCRPPEEFEAGEDISEFVDWTKMRRPGRETRRVNVDFPGWVVEALHREVQRLRITRQALVKLRIAERLDRAA
jgi:hypothetical protein